MKKMLILAVTLFALPALSQDKPVNAVEEQKLPQQLSVEKWFVGGWICEGTQHASRIGRGANSPTGFAIA